VFVGVGLLATPLACLLPHSLAHCRPHLHVAYLLGLLGLQVTGIVAPVSICMALTVALVRILNPDGESDSNAVFLASAYYTEKVGRLSASRSQPGCCWVLFLCML